MNISEKTYQQLKAKIIANELKGAISENELCLELNVSRTPLREALFRLMTEGWIEPSKNKTKTIKPITFSEIRDIFQIRKDIEIMVLNLSWDNQVPQCYQAIKNKIEAGFEQQNTSLLLEADNELHEQLLSDCHNAIVTKTLSFIYDRLRMLRSDKMKSDSIIDSSEEHLKICDGIIARDIEQTREAIAQHVKNSYNRLFSSFQ
ncbi:hypothetical protein C3432_16130 [Citrobacter amalonaticus]|uniref:GntR family transcriptional regulator n=1 Tax=Citrobacter amalonaticus TaxID=35703 RepID=A0A2S4RT08_CITAM|nr:GntR family transcriptional regulator [Citrobacter amalonaticus]POT56905.1 hypothetical protein C3432_16130 [Citrobacter amalonaticus]POT71851.1 hypothetical protein C3436_21740 [Citrobacter amalonaticus]POU62991.1 hypothetical protein C3430_19995 [Citrobacter amalonaticus]POV04795.1 hypothetical protein C3424_16920 [Citrobacter amalonaticus]